MRKTKKITKKTMKKVTRRKRKTKLVTINPAVIADIDKVYQAINRVQVARESTKILILESDSIIMDNILKDLSLPFSKIPKSDDKYKCVEYTINPAEESQNDMEFDDLDEFPDELLEDGQIFFD